MKKKIGIYVAAPGFLLMAAFAHAGPGMCQEPVPGQAMEKAEDLAFKKMDANGDGVVSKNEFNEFNARHFKEMDANKDGKVTREEMNASASKVIRNGLTHLEERFAAADTDHDGGLDRKEAEAMPVMLAYFDEIDTDKNGKITREEYLAAMPLLHRAKNIGPKVKDQSL